MSSYSPFCIAPQLRGEGEWWSYRNQHGSWGAYPEEGCMPQGNLVTPWGQIIYWSASSNLPWATQESLSSPSLPRPGAKKKNCPIFPQHVCLIQVTTCNTAVNNQNFSSWPSSGGAGCSEDQAQIRGSLSPRCPSAFTRGFQKHWDLQFSIKQKCRHITTFVSLALTEHCRHTQPFSGYLLLWQEFLST